MTDKRILHMLNTTRHASPFDINMALDAGYDAVLPYSNVTAEEVAGLVQDAIFSRPPKVAIRTGIFIGGKDALMALDMLKSAGRAMVPPFIVSLFADPAGSFTTAAAMVAKVERALDQAHGRGLSGLKLLVFGATGVVGFASAVIAALEGAQLTLVGHDGTHRVSVLAKEMQRRFGSTATAADGSKERQKEAMLRESDAVLCAGPAGVQILSAAQLAACPDLLVAADVNAVPPAGIEGLDVHADASPISGGKALGIGALAIGHIKYRTQIGLFRRMIETDKPLTLDFRDAFAMARELVRGNG